MNKKNLFIILILIVIVVLGGGYWWAQSKGITIGDAAKKITGNSSSGDLEDPSTMFEVEIPVGFNDTQKERLNDKINLSRNLYDTKKDETWTWITIGNMYEFAEDYDRAIAAYERAAELNQAEYISRLNIAYIYENYKQDYSKAEEYYKKVIELSPGNPDTYVQLARLYDFKMGQPDNAEQTYLLGLQKINNHPDILVMLIRFYQQHTNTAKVAEYSKLLLTLNPTNEAYKRDFGEFAK